MPSMQRLVNQSDTMTSKPPTERMDMTNTYNTYETGDIIISETVSVEIEYNGKEFLVTVDGKTLEPAVNLHEDLDFSEVVDLVTRSIIESGALDAAVSDAVDELFYDIDADDLIDEYHEYNASDAAIA